MSLQCNIACCVLTAFIHVRRPTEAELISLPITDVTEEENWIPYDDDDARNINAISSRPHHEFSSAMQSYVNAFSAGFHNGTTSNFHDYYEPHSEHLLEHLQRSISSTITSKPKNALTPEYLASIRNCGKETARKTIEATTCKHYCKKERGITQRFKPSRNFMRYRQISLPAGEFFTDTFSSKVKSIRGYKYSQVYGNKFGFLKCYPMESHAKEQVGDTLSVFIQDVGVVQKLHTDNATEMVG